MESLQENRNLQPLKAQLRLTLDEHDERYLNRMLNQRENLIRLINQLSANPTSLLNLTEDAKEALTAAGQKPPSALLLLGTEAAIDRLRHAKELQDTLIRDFLTDSLGASVTTALEQLGA